MRQQEAFLLLPLLPSPLLRGLHCRQFRLTNHLYFSLLRFVFFYSYLLLRRSDVRVSSLQQPKTTEVTKAWREGKHGWLTAGGARVVDSFPISRFDRENEVQHSSPLLFVHFFKLIATELV